MSMKLRNFFIAILFATLPGLTYSKTNAKPLQNSNLTVLKADENQTSGQQIFATPLVKSTYIKIKDESIRDTLDLSNLNLYTGNEGIDFENLTSLQGDDLLSIKEYHGDYQVFLQDELLYDSTIQGEQIVEIDSRFETGVVNLTIKAPEESNLVDGTLPIVVSEPLPTFTSLLFIEELPAKIDYSIGETISFDGLVVRKVYYESTVADPSTNYGFYFNTTITSTEILNIDQLDIIYQDTSTGSIDENNTINSMGLYAFAIGENGHTDGEIETWDPQFCLLNFFVIETFDTLLPSLRLEIISQPENTKYYANEVYSPNGLVVGLKVNYDNEDLDFYIQVIGFKTTYVNNSNQVIEIKPGETFKNISDGNHDITISFDFEGFSFETKYQIEFSNTNSTDANDVDPTSNGPMLFAIVGGIIFIVLGVIGLVLHIVLNIFRKKK